MCCDYYPGALVLTAPSHTRGTHLKTFRAWQLPAVRWLLVSLALSACARTRGPAARADGATPIATRGQATVFTDTALFTKLCVESDSGLTALARRCTPRDQGLRIR